jgi:glyoxylase-like metal-dependent hydrolase (beta-lactamase superfamily II)
MPRLSRRWKLVLACTVILGVPAVVTAVLSYMSRGGDPEAVAAAARPLGPEPVAVVPKVYLLGRSSPGAVYAVETSDGLVLVDSGIDPSARAVIEQLSELGLDPARLRAILLTHVHADHVLGAVRLREQTGARVFVGRDDCGPLRAGGPREAFLSTFNMPGVTPIPVAVDVELAGGEELRFGDATFHVLAAPGHTPGSVCYLLERAGLRVLFAGDVVQSLSPSNPDALGTYAAYLPPRYRGDARAYRDTLRRLRDLPVPHLILPGHPRMDPEPHSPHLSVDEWYGLLDRGIGAMDTLLARYEADGASFLDGNPKELLPGLRYLGDLDGSAVYAVQSGQEWYLFDAPGGPALSAFVEQRLSKAGMVASKITAVLLTSTASASTSGLAELVRKTGSRVVAPAAGLDDVRRICPPGTGVDAADQLTNVGDFALRAMPLGGRGTPAVAYSLRRANRDVLVSGVIPVKIVPETLMPLINDLAAAGRRAAYIRSLNELRQLTPNLWLPLTPVNGQNANVYDREWSNVLEANLDVAR